MENDPKQINIQLKPEVAVGKYSNLAIITHSRAEFIIDFAAMLPGLKQPEIVTRILMTPENAKNLLGALMENIGKYEQQFGQIESGARPKGTFNLADLAAQNGTKS